MAEWILHDGYLRIILRAKAKCINTYIKFILFSFFSSLRPSLAYRVFNTWMGDPGKVILLEAVVDVIRRDQLLPLVQRVGDKLYKGLRQLENEFSNHINSTRGIGTFLAFSCATTKLRDDLVRRLRTKGNYFYSFISRSVCNAFFLLQIWKEKSSWTKSSCYSISPNSFQFHQAIKCATQDLHETIMDRLSLNLQLSYSIKKIEK